MKILTVIGARPQFIKAAAVSRALAACEDVHEVIVHTGQHFDANMSDIFFDEMDIPKPDHHLEINGVSHGAMTGRMMEKIEEILLTEKPDFVLVYGDTNSTLAGALAAKKLHFRVAHVEAGLRSFNMAMPEEVNRIVTDRISDVLYCPTDTAVGNLEREGFEHYDCRIAKTGDVMEDAARYYASRAEARELVEGLNEIGERETIVMPLHPRTKAAIRKQGLTLNVTQIAPVGYFDMVTLLRHATLVLTDSGGLQKEAYFFDSYCVTLRDQTEWVDHG